MTTYTQAHARYTAKIVQKLIRFNPEKIMDKARLEKLERMDNVTERVKQWLDSLPDNDGKPYNSRFFDEFYKGKTK